MVKKPAKVFSFYFLLFSFAIASALSVIFSAPAAVFANAPINGFFTSPTGIFVVETVSDKTVYAADAYLGILTSKNGGALKQAFKGAGNGHDYKGVFVWRNSTLNIVITLDYGKLAFLDMDYQAKGQPHAGYIPDDAGGLVSETFSDIALDGNILWAAQGGSLYKIQLSVDAGKLKIVKTQEYLDIVSGNIACVEPADDSILIAANSPLSGGGLYMFDFTTAAFVRNFNQKINDIAFFKDKGRPFAAVSYQKNTIDVINFTDDTVRAFTPPPALPLAEGGIAAASYLYAHNGGLYVCDADTRAAAVFNLPELTFKELLFVSSGDAPGLLKNAEGCCAWDDKLFIADTWNGRIQVWGAGGGITVFGGGGLIRPTAVTVDALGRVYAVDDHKRVLKYDAAYNYVLTSGDIIPQSGNAAYITGIAAAADGRIYISDSKNNMIWAADDGLVFGVYYDDFAVRKPVAVCASFNRNALYVLKDNGAVEMLTPPKPPAQPLKADGIEIYPGAGGAEIITAFAADCQNNILILQTEDAGETITIVKLEAADPNDPDVYSAAAAFPLPLDYEYAAYNITHMSFSPVTGNIYLTDALKSRVYTLPPDETAALGAKWLSPADYIPPVKYADNTALDAGKYKTAPLNSEALLYELPTASKASEVLPRGTNAVVLYRDYNGFYSFVYLPALDKAGYVLTVLLGGDNPADAPLFTDGRIFNDNTPVYKFPSGFAPKVHGGDGKALSFSKDKRVTLAPYSKAADVGPERWYCIELDGGKIGFVNVLNVANYKYQPTTSILKTNADIVKSAADGGAVMHEKDGGDYNPMSVPPLKDGDRVKIAGRFKANKKYTEIIYQDADLGLIQGYVLTKYIKYDTATNLQWLMLGLLLALAAVAVFIVYLVRRGKSRSGGNL